MTPVTDGKSNLRFIQEAKPRMGLADYIWLSQDGTHIEAKTLPICVFPNEEPRLPPCTISMPDPEHPRTLRQLMLSPAHYLPDPLRPQPSYIVLCEVRDQKGHPVPWCNRANLRQLLPTGDGPDPYWWGIHQFWDTKSPEKNCSLGEVHIRACLDSGLLIHDVCLSRSVRLWPSFKIGPRGFPKEVDVDPPSALVVGDHLWIARYLLARLARAEGQDPHLSEFPLTLFFSTAATRESSFATRQLEPILLKSPVRSFGGSVQTLMASPKCFYVRMDLLKAYDPYVAMGSVLEALKEKESEKDPKD